jgi:hypothetical protein
MDAMNISEVTGGVEGSSGGELGKSIIGGESSPVAEISPSLSRGI